MRARAVTFAARWKDETSERGQSQSFWTEFLDIYGVDRKRVAAFEQLAKRTSTGNYGFIDLYWPGVLIAEQKSAGKDLAEAEKQALDYLTDIKQSDFPGLVITSDFGHIRILDLEAKDPQPVEIKTADLGKEYERFLFIAGYAKQTFEQEIEANVEASELMGQLYDAAEAAGYKDHEANVLLTRLLFLMFGDDTAMWARGLFYSFVHDRTSDDASDLGAQLAMLFQVLNTPEAERPKNLDQTLVDFPYVNGGLFSENLRIAAFTPDMRHALIKAMRFGWAAISPAVFGSLFQSVKSKELRRELGEHYTPEKTIMKVIAPLFLDDLKERLAGAKGSPQKLRNLRKELATYNFLDPACGCGNFLIIAYREMRRLELEILKQLRDLKEENQLSLDPTLGLQVTVSQFAGIEIEEWPAKVAETAMFLVDHQMNLELAQEFGQTPDRLPIKEVLVVRVGNALKQAWSEVAPVGQNTVVLGNPPFLGRAQRSAEQSDDMKLIWGSARGAGDLDYVACWFHKAADYVSGSSARVGFVSTNSLTQGEQPAVLWGYLLSKSMKIDFAHRTFNWTNEARGKAAVHVVVIGFSQGTTKALKPLWTYVDVDGSGTREDVEAINAYLLPGPMVTVGSRTDPLVPEMPIATYGSMPIENGHLVVTADEAAHLKNNDADAFGVLRRYVGAQELLHGEERYCLWLEGVDPSVIRASKFIMDRVTKSKEFREASNRPATRALASTPGLFGERRQPLAEYIAIPKVSSERRRYIPMSILDPSVISSGSLILVRGPNIRLAFGVLSSRAMTLWNSVVSGRMTSRFQFSVEVTYNNFPWPSISKPQEDEIVRTVDEVLSVRAKYGGTILADLYDPTSMPPDLASAHASLDKAVLATYGLKPAATEAEVLATLFARYEVLAAPLAAGMTAKPKRRAKKT